MSNSIQLKMDAEKIQEMPMVDLAFAVLKAANTPFYYLDLMKEVAKLRGLSDEEMKETIAQLYTEINIDGRFACVGTNLWGLKRWYPVDRSEDPISSSKRPRIINDDDDDEEDDFNDDDDTFSGDDADEDFDRIDEDHDDIYSDDDSEDEVDDDVLLEDEDMDEDGDSGEDDEESEDEDDLEEDEY